MINQVSRGWRVIATGLSYFSFGLGGLLLRLLVFPAINLLVLERPRRIRIARNVIRYAFRAFVESMRALGLLRYEITGREKLERKGLLILANHPTLIDTVFLMAFVKGADCIAKRGLWDNSFTNGPVRAAAYIKNEDGPELVEQCIASLEAGNNLIIFPEGTRTPCDGAPLSFKRGAANVAVRGRRCVTPVRIRCTPPTLGKGSKWWQVPACGARFLIEVQDDIDIQPFIAAAETQGLAARRLTDYLQSQFAKEDPHHVVA